MAKQVTPADSSTKCKTPLFRVSFPNVFEAKSFEGGPAKYSIVMLFDEGTDLSPLETAVDNAAKAKWGPDKKKWPKNLRLPFREGSEKPQLDGYEGCIFASASSKQRPAVVDKKKATIFEGDETFYAGCYAYATLNAFAYDKAGNKGVAFGLNNIQKVKDGEPFSGRSSADEDFEEISDDSDDESNYDSDDDI